MNGDRRPPEVRAYEEGRFERPLARPDVQTRLAVLDDIREHNYTRAIPRLIPMLECDDPYVGRAHGTPHVFELRARVLETLEYLYRLRGNAPDFGPVKERMPMSADDAIAAAHAATATMTDAERAALAAPIDAWLATQSIESPEERDALRAFRTLQALGKVEYRLENVDPETYLTPLQQEIVDDQLRAPRPRPHVRVAREGKHDETLGWIYRKPDGRWNIDFSAAWDAREVESTAARIFGRDPDGVPNVVFGPDGQPLKNPGGWLESDRVIPLDSDETIEILRSVAARLGEFEDVELVL